MGMLIPELSADVTSTKEERATKMSVAERYILLVGNIEGSPGSESPRG
jgi:hypothetical protein